MVKLEGLTEKEIEIRKELEQLDILDDEFYKIEQRFINITKKLFGGRAYAHVSDEGQRNCRSRLGNIVIGPRLFDFSKRNKYKVITSNLGTRIIGTHYPPYYTRDPSKNIILVDSGEYLEEALKLANAYEKASFGEFTVKKEYAE